MIIYVIVHICCNALFLFGSIVLKFSSAAHAKGQSNSGVDVVEGKVFDAKEAVRFRSVTVW